MIRIIQSKSKTPQNIGLANDMAMPKFGAVFSKLFKQSGVNGVILSLGLTSRFIVLVSAIVGYYTIGVREPFPNEGLWDLGLPVVNLFSRWDAGHYINIALNGYSVGLEGPSEAWAFFPLYPLLMRITGVPFAIFFSEFQAVAVAGFLISNVLFFILIIFFYKLSEIVLKNNRLALLSTIVFLVWPGSLFYSCVYPECLFMTLIVTALYFLERGKNFEAMILGFLAGWARPTGFLVFVPFVYKAIEKRSLRLFFQSLIVSSPYLLFSLYGFVITGIFPIREWVYMKYWSHPITLVFFQLLDYPLPQEVPKLGYSLLALVELIFVMTVIAGLLLSKDLLVATLSLGLKRRHDEAKYYGFALAIFPTILFYGTINNLHRYALALIPMYWVLGKIASRHEAIMIVLISIMLMMVVIGTVLFATWRYYL
ncbi:MAG: mannosyltransferase family protein [Candidatus Bathyarchaeia archaeon]